MHQVVKPWGCGSFSADTTGPHAALEGSANVAVEQSPTAYVHQQGRAGGFRCVFRSGLEPPVQTLRGGGMQHHIPVFPELAFSDEQSAFVRVNIGYGQRECLADAQTGCIEEADEQRETLRKHGAGKSGAGDCLEQRSDVRGGVEAEPDHARRAEGVFAQYVPAGMERVEVEREPAHGSELPDACLRFQVRGGCDVAVNDLAGKHFKPVAIGHEEGVEIAEALCGADVVVALHAFEGHEIGHLRGQQTVKCHGVHTSSSGHGSAVFSRASKLILL